MKQDPELRLKAVKVMAVSLAAVAAVIAVCVTVYFVTVSNNARTMREAELQETARKSKAQDDLEASKVRAAKEVREAEIKSKKRKIWERDAAGDPGGPESPPFFPGKEGF